MYFPGFGQVAYGYGHADTGKKQAWRCNNIAVACFVKSATDAE